MHAIELDAAEAGGGRWGAASVAQHVFAWQLQGELKMEMELQMKTMPALLEIVDARS